MDWDREMVKDYTNEEVAYDYKTKKILKNNTIAVVEMYASKITYKSSTYSMYLGCLSKRKHSEYRDNYLENFKGAGVEALLFGKECLLDFESFVLKEDRRENISIEICWDDNRRRNCYARTLLKHGYRFSKTREGVKCLRKKLR